MVDFSIIIPVYNAERTLEKCLASVNAQTFINYEVILIDDGSTDKSLEICKRYEVKDKRFHVIWQSNSGPSAARNAGLDVAKGKWICFVDSDDTIERDYLQEIYNVTQKKETDVVFFGHSKVYPNGETDFFVPDDVDVTKIKTIIALAEKDMFGYTWIKCFRKDSIGSIKFDSSLNLFEDEVFTCQVLSNCERIDTVKRHIYNYYIGDGSTLIGRTHEDYCLKNDKVYLAWKEMLSEVCDSYNILNQKANTFVKRCYYYAFERDVDIKRYFSYLKESLFFQEHTSVNALDELVRNGNYKKLAFAKMKYQAKVHISFWLQNRK